MRDLRSYVVRVYRQQAGSVAGTVQEVGTGRTTPFRTMEELWQAVRSAPPSSGAEAIGMRRGKGAAADRPETTKHDAWSEGDEQAE